MKKIMIAIIAIVLIVNVFIVVSCENTKSNYMISFAKSYLNSSRLFQFGSQCRYCDKTLISDDGSVARIFYSNQKLLELYKESENLNILKTYNDAFFEKNALIILMGISFAGDAVIEVKSLNINKSLMTIEMNYVEQNYNETGVYCIVLETEKKIIEQVDELKIISNSQKYDEINDVKNKAMETYLNAYVQVRYPNATISDISFRPFLGIYNEAIVGTFYGGQYHGEWPEYEQNYNIDGYLFSFSKGYPILVWKENKIFELPSAYNDGILTKENLSDIYNLYMMLN